MARNYLGGLLRDCRRWPHALRDWFQKDQRECEARGRKLLREWLSPQQLAEYEANGYFDVTGGDTGRRYRIREGIATNVYEIDAAGRPLAGWCFVPKGDLVAGDVILAQKICLESDERGVLAIANNFEIKLIPL